MTPKFHPKKIKVLHLMCADGKADTTSVLSLKLAPRVCLQKSLWWQTLPKQLVTGSGQILVKLTVRMDRDEVAPSFSALTIRLSRNHTEIERDSYMLNTMQILPSMILPSMITAPDQHSIDLYPQNSLESLKWTLELPTVRAAALTATSSWH